MEKPDNSIERDNHEVKSHDPWKSCAGKCSNKQMLKREALLEAKSALIDNTIYQVRTLSNAVIGFCELLSMEVLSEDASEYAKEIQNAGKGLSVLSNEMLDWTQLLTGKIKIQKAKFFLSDILYEIHKMLSWSAQKKGLTYEIVTDPDMPAYINSDQDRLLKCLVNLTASAIKHTQQGSIKIHVKIEEFGNKPFIRFDIIDTGEGIEADKLDTIFEPNSYRIEMDEEILSQLDKGLTVTTGLPLTKQLCEQLGGTIKAISRVNEGSTFTLRVPAGVDISAEPKLGHSVWNNEEISQGLQDTSSAPSGTILLVEDQQSNRTVITLMLETLGVTVQTAVDGQDALGKCESNTYDLILMDIKMPNMDGYETTQRLRQQGIQTPIVALSATVLNDKEPHQIMDQFDGFLTKPVDSQRLSGALKHFLRSPCSGQDDTDVSSRDEDNEFELSSMKNTNEDEQADS